MYIICCNAPLSGALYAITAGQAISPLPRPKRQGHLEDGEEIFFPHVYAHTGETTHIKPNALLCNRESLSRLNYCLYLQLTTLC
jgi:hypothetical protein